MTQFEDRVVKEHQDMVTELVKPGRVVADEMDSSKVAMWDAAIRICLFAEQALSNAKRRVIYNKEVNLYDGEPMSVPEGTDYEQVAREMTSSQANLLHAATGIATEALELLGSVLQSSLHGMPFDQANATEEMGDLEFYMEQMRQEMGVSRSRTLNHNIGKLRKRYSEGYSDTAAEARADKEDPINDTWSGHNVG